VGISVAIFISILIDSLQNTLIQSTVGNAPHITITKDDNSISEYDDLKNNIQNVGDITKIYPVVEGNGLLVTANKNYPVLLKGGSFDKENDIYKIEDKLTSGSLPNGENEIIIGNDLAETIGVDVGDSVTVSKANGTENKFQISGIYDLKISAINNSWLFTDLRTAWETFGNQDDYTSIYLQVGQIFDADIIADEVKDQVGSRYAVDNWKAQNAQLLSGLQGQSVSSYMIQVFVLISVLISITSILTITVTQKSRQIGILKAIGLNNSNSSRIFLFQGSILGFIGTLLGVLFGLGLFYAFAAFAKNPDGSNIVDPIIRWNMVFLTGTIALAVSSIAGIIPAKKANKLSPIEVIRNG
jgi:lipoprotein-releasing system permease protein